MRILHEPQTEVELGGQPGRRGRGEHGSFHLLPSFPLWGLVEFSRRPGGCLTEGQSPGNADADGQGPQG